MFHFLQMPRPNLHRLQAGPFLVLAEALVAAARSRSRCAAARIAAGSTDAAEAAADVNVLPSSSEALSWVRIYTYTDCGSSASPHHARCHQCRINIVKSIEKHQSGWRYVVDVVGAPAERPCDWPLFRQGEAVSLASLSCVPIS